MKLQVQKLEAKATYRIETSAGVYLQHYDTVVFMFNRRGKNKISPMWNCSITTQKRVTDFCGLSAPEIKKWITAGKLKVEDMTYGGE